MFGWETAIAKTLEKCKEGRKLGMVRKWSDCRGCDWAAGLVSQGKGRHCVQVRQGSCWQVAAEEDKTGFSSEKYGCVCHEKDGQ